MSHVPDRLATTPLPTLHGTFTCVAFADPQDPAVTHVAMVRGDVAGDAPVPVRVHSECFTGEVLHSVKCDCRRQLDAALDHIDRADRGVVVYLRQEGRGIGLVAKLKAYALQAGEGLDTVDANRRLGLPDDARSYEVAAGILQALGVKRVELLTNNPAKVAGLEKAGIAVVRRVPVVVAQGDAARAYLETKVARMGHVLGPDGSDPDKKAG